MAIGSGALFAILAGAGFVAFAASSSGKKPVAEVLPQLGPPLPIQPVPGEPAVGPASFVTGKSGKKWRVQTVSNKNGVAEIDVYSLAGSFGPHQEIRVLRYGQNGSDKNARYFIAAPAEVPAAMTQAAMSDFGVPAPKAGSNPVVITPSPVPSNPAQAAAEMPVAMKTSIANVLRLLTVDEEGILRGPVTKAGIQAATELAGRLRAQGYPEAATQLETYAKQAAAAVPPPPPAQQVTVPGVPPELQTQIYKALELQRDPAKLAILKQGLLSLPPSPQRDSLIGMLDALILQLTAKQGTDSTLEQIDTVLRTPVSPAPAPAPTPRPPVSTLPEQPTNVPARPVAQPAPVALTPDQIAAANMVRNLKAVQAAHGMPKAKGKEDMSLVKKFQGLVGAVQDGKAGPNTLVLAAGKAVGDLPLVMYWPKNSTQKTVAAYKESLGRLADKWFESGRPDIADALHASQLREKGQAGVG